MRKTVFIKVSGDLVDSEDVLHWIKDLTKEYYVVICIGGGKQINTTFEELNKQIGKHGPLGRETSTLEDRQIARNVLEKNQANLQDTLASKGIYATVIIPVLDIGSVLCHVNGDILTLTSYHGYDKLYIITTKDRVEDKQRKFFTYPKIEVIGF